MCSHMKAKIHSSNRVIFLVTFDNNYRHSHYFTQSIPLGISDSSCTINLSFFMCSNILVKIDRLGPILDKQIQAMY